MGIKKKKSKTTKKIVYEVSLKGYKEDIKKEFKDRKEAELYFNKQKKIEKEKQRIGEFGGSDWYDTK